MTTHTDPPEGARADGDDESLPCGRPLSRVWDDWERQTDDPHTATCPHCRTAVDDLALLESAVRGLREETPDPSAHDAEPLTRRVMDLVRLELRPGRPLPLGEPAEDLWIMETVAARVLRAAAETVEGVRAGSCRIVDADGHEGGAVEVRLDIHAPVDAALRPLAERVRQRVREAADRELGLVTASVDIRVTDLVDVRAEGREGDTA
ncbi:Asp23/Gls24 family envelope stress response protein [Streptomyces heilongjiangensis]|uniref:Asp23/Gls24 family envelope stress response protein n=1 Tax=Streptomyces heilongjiangensis TaxID=945052 RepID=A0ABW1BA29_9ACTN|nr:Asp23/Gls24 family envelope stress response protein [Streptomyces heilongjiangensis]MDC2946302.1 Asp23/Gls24 family envelope stress response protein [Streptomyces heilongjiangensis]